MDALPICLEGLVDGLNESRARGGAWQVQFEGLVPNDIRNLTKTEVEELLDWLEAKRYWQLQLSSRTGTWG